MNWDNDMKIPADLTNKLTPVTEVFLPKRRYDVALDSLLKVKSEFPTHHIVDYYLGICYSNLNQFGEALHRFKKIINSKQLNIVQLTQVNMVTGLIQTEQNKLENAQHSFENAIKINPSSSMSYSALGYVHYLTKRYDLAIQNFKMALSLDPNNAGAHNNLGYTLSEIGVNLNEAIRSCRKAVALYPNSAAYRDSLGWAYYVAGNFAESASELQKALALAPNNETIKEHLKKAMNRRDRS